MTGQIIINCNRFYLGNSFTFHCAYFSPIPCCVQNSSGKKYVPRVWARHSLLKSAACREGSVQTLRMTLFNATQKLCNEELEVSGKRSRTSFPDSTETARTAAPPPREITAISLSGSVLFQRAVKLLLGSLVFFPPWAAWLIPEAVLKMERKAAAINCLEIPNYSCKSTAVWEQPCEVVALFTGTVTDLGTEFLAYIYTKEFLLPSTAGPHPCSLPPQRGGQQAQKRRTRRRRKAPPAPAAHPAPALLPGKLHGCFQQRKRLSLLPGNFSTASAKNQDAAYPLSPTPSPPFRPAPPLTQKIHVRNYSLQCLVFRAAC